MKLTENETASRYFQRLDQWLILAPGWIVLISLLLVQVPGAFDYEWMVSLGLQESEDEISPVGVAFGVGCCVCDTIFYVPLLLVGLLGFPKHRCAHSCLSAALGITLYWPVMYLVAFQRASQLEEWNLDLTNYRIVVSTSCW